MLHVTAMCFYLGRLPCSVVTYSLLGSYLAQSLLGDYDPAEHGTGCDYLRHMQFAPSTCQNDELLETIAELHRSRRGLSSASAELEYLINASRLAMYGVDLHPVLVILLLLLFPTTPQPFYGPFSGTTRMSRCQKRTSGLYGARAD